MLNSLSGDRRESFFRPRWRTALACTTLLFATMSLAAPAFAWQDDADPPGESSTDGLREPAAPDTPAQKPGLAILDASADLGSIPTRLSEMFVAGGWVMWPIALCSIVAFTFAIERMVVLRRRRVIPRDFVDRFIEHLEQGQLDRNEAIELCLKNGSPIADVFLHGVRKWGKPSVEVEQAIIDGGERQVGHLRKHLRILNGVSTITPLLGLLGTVFGMIMCFNQIATSSAMGKSEQLAGGIGVALLTTAFGLTVAIPAMLVYMYFAGRIDALVMEMDSVSQKVVDLISAEGLVEQAAVPPRGSPPRPKGIHTSPATKAT
ncbi:MAG: MotA/TolQ/ExbB proton channel family protein [Planctomycetota bacterium]|nr:MotA/TolQ/ExbB proton channel family protein [Planctomycetota bacterium]